MNVKKFDILGPLLLQPDVFKDNRGYFFESFRDDRFNDILGKEIHFMQDNQSYSAAAGTVRGLHYQSPPHAQAKLVRCVFGKIIDVIVDVRIGSPTYGQSIKAVLSSKNQNQLFVPRGFLHGFVTTEPDSVVCYKVDQKYAPEADGNVRWNSLDIDWGILNSEAVLSTKDTEAPLFEDWTSPFHL